MSPSPLNHADLSVAVRLGPIVAIDLIIRDDSDRVLLGFRTNEPAKGVYFVPGGRIWKDERISDAFERILKAETNYAGTFDQARFRGVHEHFYETNRFGEPGYGSHYVALIYEIRIGINSQLRTDAQHTEFVWWAAPTILTSDRVHENTKAYFR